MFLLFYHYTLFLAHPLAPSEWEYFSSKTLPGWYWVMTKLITAPHLTLDPGSGRQCPQYRMLTLAPARDWPTRRGPGPTHAGANQRQPGPFYTYTCLLSTLLEYEFGGDISCLRTQLPPTPDRLRAPRLRVPSPQRVFLLLYRGERLERRL